MAGFAAGGGGGGGTLGGLRRSSAKPSGRGSSTSTAAEVSRLLREGVSAEWAGAGDAVVPSPRVVLGTH